MIQSTNSRSQSCIKFNLSKQAKVFYSVSLENVLSNLNFTAPLKKFLTTEPIHHVRMNVMNVMHIVAFHKVEISQDMPMKEL
jgi:hypothetical protein